MKNLKQYITTYLNTIRVGWFLAFRQLRRAGRGTTVLIVFVMVLTFLNLVAVSGLLLGLISGSFLQYRNNYSGEVIVTPAEGREFIENSSQLIHFLENHPKVTALSPRYVIGAQILGTLTEAPKKGEKTNSAGARLVGIDPIREDSTTGLSKFVRYGAPLAKDDEGYILAGANILKKYSNFADANIPGLDLLENVDIGSRLRVTLPQPDGIPVVKEFILKGVIKSKVDELSTRFFITDKEMKRLLPVNKDKVQEIAIRTDYAFAPQLVNEIKDFMGISAARVQTSDDAVPSFLRDIESAVGIIGNVLSSIALMVATITVFIVVFINAVTKRKFIGIMKGIGISPMAVQISYILQALFYGLTGSLIGMTLTFGVLKPFFAVHPINFPFSDGILVVTWGGTLIRVLILIVITILAGYVPAKLIVRRSTLDAILGR